MLRSKVRRRENKTGRHDKWEQKASSCRCSLGARAKGPASGVFLNPAADNTSGGIAGAEDPLGGCGVEGSMASYWKSPDIPERDFQKRSLEGAGVSTIWLGVLVPGTRYPHHPSLLSTAIRHELTKEEMAQVLAR